MRGASEWIFSAFLFNFSSFLFFFHQNYYSTTIKIWWMVIDDIHIRLCDARDEICRWKIMVGGEITSHKISIYICLMKNGWNERLLYHIGEWISSSDGTRKREEGSWASVGSNIQRQSVHFNILSSLTFE